MTNRQSPSPSTIFRPSPSPSYWTVFLFYFTIPSVADSWRQFIVSKSSTQWLALALVLHRSFKAVCGCLLWLIHLGSISRWKRPSEIEFALKAAQESTRKCPLEPYRDVEEDEADLLIAMDDSDEAGADGSLISDLAVWRVDWVLQQSSCLQKKQVMVHQTSDLEELALAITAVKTINPIFCPTLVQCLERIQSSVQSRKMIEERSKTTYDPASHRYKLKELLKLLKPDQNFESMPTKGWQQIGFQGADPSTDLRGTGLLGLDALIVFGRYYGSLGQELVTEAIEGGSSWYPWALASINITWWCISLARKQALHFFLLGSELFSPNLIDDLPAELGQFLVLQVKLTYLFHQFWIRLEPKPNVMQFEEKFKVFKKRVEGGLTKGLIGGLGIGWIVKKDDLQVGPF